jgi:DNA-binding CsgD family transcriptional regulator
VKVAAQTVAQWSGRALDPAVTAVFLDAPDELLGICDPDDLQAAAVECEPQPRRVFRDDAALDDALAGFGDAADLKSPWFTGHSGGVARLAMAAAGQLEPAVARLVHRAGLVHDIGRVAVPTGIWERPGALRPEDWELVRLHPYHSGRILARSPVLAPLGEIACRHHERTDGSGYPAGMRGSELDAAACLLAAADVFHALGEPRLPAGLTERELDVLRLLAAGRTKREIASDLVISPSTVHTHTVHIYAKCGVSTRAALAMFAMRHGLAARAHQAGSGQASRP